MLCQRQLKRANLGLQSEVPDDADLGTVDIQDDRWCKVGDVHSRLQTGVQVCTHDGDGHVGDERSQSGDPIVKVVVPQSLVSKENPLFT